MHMTQLQCFINFNVYDFVTVIWINVLSVFKKKILHIDCCRSLSSISLSIWLREVGSKVWGKTFIWLEAFLGFLSYKGDPSKSLSSESTCVMHQPLSAYHLTNELEFKLCPLSHLHACNRWTFRPFLQNTCRSRMNAAVAFHSFHGLADSGESGKSSPKLAVKVSELTLNEETYNKDSPRIAKNYN